MSCPSAGFCAAVDDAGSSGSGGNVLTYNGSAWSSTPVSGVTAYGLESVSCSSQSFCVAGDAMGNAFTYDSLNGSQSKTVTSGGGLSSLSCPTAGFCAGVGPAGNAVTYNGTTSAWSNAISIDPPGKGLVSVSCPSAGFCAAVDPDGNAWTYNGSDWSGPVSIESGNGHDIVPRHFLKFACQWIEHS